MNTITRQDFLSRFSAGAALERMGRPAARLARFDTDQDGVLRRPELDRLFTDLDRRDQDGSRDSLRLSGRAARVCRLLRRGRLDRPHRGEAIAAAARDRLRRMGEEYGVAGAPTSPHPRLSHNRDPGVTRLGWLRGQWKCNQFVGDALTQAGLAMPVHRMPDGSVHYMQAEALPHQPRYFSRITALEQLRTGDLVVLDFPGRGAGTAHAEIFSEVRHRRGGIRSIGAHREGASEEPGWRSIGDWHEGLRAAAFDGEERRWEHPGVTIYLLRPIRDARPGG